MDLTISNAETLEELDTCKAEDWLLAVQYVEKNKSKYRKAGCTEVSIVSDEGVCKWELTAEKRPHILKDKIHSSSKFPRKKKRKKTFQEET